MINKQPTTQIPCNLDCEQTILVPVDQNNQIMTDIDFTICFNNKEISDYYKEELKFTDVVIMNINTVIDILKMLELKSFYVIYNTDPIKFDIFSLI